MSNGVKYLTCLEGGSDWMIVSKILALGGSSRHVVRGSEALGGSCSHEPVSPGGSAKEGPSRASGDLSWDQMRI